MSPLILKEGNAVVLFRCLTVYLFTMFRVHLAINNQQMRHAQKRAKSNVPCSWLMRLELFDFVSLSAETGLEKETKKFEVLFLTQQNNQSLMSPVFDRP